MHFVVDESTGYGVVSYLREQGHDVVSVAGWGENGRIKPGKQKPSPNSQRKQDFL